MPVDPRLGRAPDKLPLRIAVDPSTGRDAAKALGTTAATFLTSASGAIVASTVAAVAGTVSASAATVPVVGWVVSAVSAVLAGLAVIVEAVCQGKVDKEQAVFWAAQLGLPDAEQVPEAIVKYARMSFTDRLNEMQREQAKVERLAAKKHLDALGQKSLAKSRTKVGILGLLLVREWLREHRVELARVAARTDKAVAGALQAGASLSAVGDAMLPPVVVTGPVGLKYAAWTPYAVGGMLLLAAAAWLL